jgi:integrase
MIALLALCPIRLKNFASLEIGRSFVQIKGAWWIVLSASETKEGRRDERPVDSIISEGIDRYLSHYRQVLARNGSPSTALWLSRNRRPMSYSMIENMISDTTLATVGVNVCPHLFRTSAASSAAIHGGDNLHLATALLHHRHPKVQQEHYNRASSLRAGQSYQEILELYGVSE